MASETGPKVTTEELKARLEKAVLDYKYHLLTRDEYQDIVFTIAHMALYERKG